MPRVVSFGALDLGNWVHDGLAAWYGKGWGRVGSLKNHVGNKAEIAIETAQAQGAPDHALDKAAELSALAEAMAEGYEREYADTDDVYVLAVEEPLEFVIPDYSGKPLVRNKLKPDLVYRAREGVWLMEHKTASQIVTGHLPLDDQARPYGAMAERALRKKGIIRANDEFLGIMYNFLRKAFPDERMTDAQGRALNKNGTVSKRQPAKNFLRYPVRMTRAMKRITLQRVRHEAVEIAHTANLLRAGTIKPQALHKTPTKGCERFCEFFAICKMDEEGSNTRAAEETMYYRRNPYLYDEENPTTEEHSGFEGL